MDEIGRSESHEERDAKGKESDTISSLRPSLVFVFSLLMTGRDLNSLGRLVDEDHVVGLVLNLSLGPLLLLTVRRGKKRVTK